MKISKSEIIGKVRIAIDEILPEGIETTDTFWKDQDKEIWQAVLIAAEQLSMELPRDLIEPVSAVKGANSVTATESSDGNGAGYIAVNTESVAPDYLGLYELKMSTWKMGVTRTIAPGSIEAMQQTNPWTAGTTSKPKVMELRTGEDVRLFFWSVGKSNGTYDYTVERLTYIPRPTVTPGTGDDDDEEINIPLVSTALPYIIYRAGRLVMTAKKESALAQEFENISKSLRMAIEQ